jgi:hypothetical protein
MQVVTGFFAAGAAFVGSVDIVDDGVTGTTYSQWTIGSDGFTYKRHTSGAADQDVSWISPQAGMSHFEVRATSLSGDVPPGFIGSWHSLGSSWTWGWTAEHNPKDGQLTIEIRDATSLVVVDSATIHIVNGGTL